jgi:hypothetical protein
MAIGRWSAVRLRRPFLSVNAHVIGRDASLMRTLAFRHFRMRVCLCVLLFDFISKKKETYRVVVHTITTCDDAPRRDRLDFYDDGYYYLVLPSC